jgi:hypothetical protein
MFRIQIGSSVMGKYARASLLILLVLIRVNSLLNIFFEFKKKLIELSEWTQGVEPYLLLQWQMVRRTKPLCAAIHRVRCPLACVDFA